MTWPPQLPICYWDHDLAVVDKPSGLLSVPGRGPDKQDCVTTRVQKIFPWARGPLMVHRLDMDTSGLLVVGLHPQAQKKLSSQFENRQVQKRYVAQLAGRLCSELGQQGEIELPFRLDVDNRPRQILDPIHGKMGVTRWERLTETGPTRVAFYPLTGRTHQLRVHAAHDRGLACPIAGDVLYGPQPVTAPRLMLHADRLQLKHPTTGQTLTFMSTPDF